MKQDCEEQGIYSLMISCAICLIVGILNLLSNHYIYAISMFIAFAFVAVEVFRKRKSKYHRNEKDY